MEAAAVLARVTVVFLLTFDAESELLNWLLIYIGWMLAFLKLMTTL